VCPDSPAGKVSTLVPDGPSLARLASAPTLPSGGVITNPTSLAHCPRDWRSCNDPTRQQLDVLLRDHPCFSISRVACALASGPTFGSNARAACFCSFSPLGVNLIALHQVGPHSPAPAALPGRSLPSALRQSCISSSSSSAPCHFAGRTSALRSGCIAQSFYLMARQLSALSG